MSHVTLIGVAGDQRTEEAKRKLASLHGLQHEYSPCPPSLGEVVCLPFLRDENGRGYFGAGAIEKFVEKQRRI